MTYRRSFHYEAHANTEANRLRYSFPVDVKYNSTTGKWELWY